MFNLEVKASGKTYRDLEEALQEVTRKIKGAYCEGYDSNETGAYHFTVTGREEPENEVIETSLHFKNGERHTMIIDQSTYNEDDPIAEYYDPSHPDNHDGCLDDDETDDTEGEGE